MPKYRKLSVTALDSLDLNAMPDDFTRLTWLLLPLVMTRDGTTYDNAQYLRSKLYPLRQDVSTEQVAAAFQCFKQLGMIKPYEVGGRAYLWIPTWQKHQGDTAREGESPLPPPPSTHELLMSNSGAGHKLLRSRSAEVAADPSSCASTCASLDASSCEVALPPESRSKAECRSSTKKAKYDTAALAACHRAWQDARGGAVNAMDSEQVTDLCDEYGADWVEAAIQEGNKARQSKLPSLKFVMAILERWKREGFRTPMQGSGKKAGVMGPEMRRAIEATKRRWEEEHPELVDAEPKVH